MPHVLAWRTTTAAPAPRAGTHTTTCDLCGSDVSLSATPSTPPSIICMICVDALRPPHPYPPLYWTGWDFLVPVMHAIGAADPQGTILPTWTPHDWTAEAELRAVVAATSWPPSDSDD